MTTDMLVINDWLREQVTETEIDHATCCTLILSKLTLTDGYCINELVQYLPEEWILNHNLSEQTDTVSQEAA